MALIGQSSQETVTVIVGASFLIIHAIWVLRKVCTAEGLKHFKEAALLAVRFLRSLASRASKERDEIDIVVDAKLVKQKVERCMRISEVLCHLYSCNMLLIVYQIVASREQAWKTSQHYAFLASYACILGMQILPRLPDRMLIDFYFSVQMLIGTAAMTPWVTPQESLLELVGSGNFVFFVLSLWLPSVRVAAFWIFCLMLSICGSLIVHSPWPCIINLNWLLVFEVLIGVSAVCLVSVLEANMRSEMRAVVEAGASRQVYSAACALLRGFCDVVVDVDSEGRIISDGYDLGGFLLRGRSLKGSRIDELLASVEERGPLLQKLKTPRQDGGSIADVIHVTIRDGNGMLLQMQLFWFAYQGIQGQFRCMVGLRRFMSSGSGDSDEVRDSLGESEVHATVDCSEVGLPVCSFSAGFGINIARIPYRASLLEYVENHQEFHVWVQRAVNTILLAEDSEQPTQMDRFKIRLRTRNGRLVAKVTLALSDASSREEGQLPEACLSFVDLKHQAPRGGAKKGSLATALRNQTVHEGSATSSGSEGRRGTRRQPAPESSGDLSGFVGPRGEHDGDGNGSSGGQSLRRQEL